MRTLITAFARHRVFANILLLIIFAGGTFASMNMVRETFPEMALDMISVSVIWPGADPEEVEEGISRKIEERIDGVEGVKRYNSTSSEGRAMVLVEVSEDYDTDQVKDRVRNAVDSVPNLPVDAEKPIIEELLLRDQVMMLALYGEDVTERQLKEWAETIEDELRELPEISQAQVMGARDYEISVEVSEENLRNYNLSFAQVANAVRQSSLNMAGGTVRTEGEDIRLRTIGRKYTGKELSDIVVKAMPGGAQVKLSDVAKIEDAFSEDELISRFNGQPNATIAVLKTPDEDALAIAARVKEYVAEKSELLPEGMSMTIWGDLSIMLKARTSLLVRNGLIGLSLVFVLLWLFLDSRLSFWAGMGMPISIAGALALMWMVGATINMISLFALILVLGIIVDDAIVVGEAIYVARKNGAPPLRAAVDGVYEVGMPVLAAVLTTIIAFLPLAFVGGIMGKFIVILPIVVISCLLISLVECLILLPAHLNDLPAQGKKNGGGSILTTLANRLHRTTNGGLEWFVEHCYTPFLRGALRWRYVAMAVSVAVVLFTAGLLQSGMLKFSMFPKLDGDEITATVEFPNGTPIEVTRGAVLRLEEAFVRIADRTETPGGEPLIQNKYSLAGATIDSAQPRSGNHLGSVRVELLGAEKRGVYSEVLKAEWQKEVGEIPGVVAMTFAGMSAGPPGAAIEVWLQGSDNLGMDPLLEAADELKAKLDSYDGVYQIQHDYRGGTNEIRFKLKPEARRLGITVADLGQQVFAGYFGEEAIRLQRGRDDIRVRVRYTDDERSKLSELDEVRIRTPQGVEVPLLSVADVEYGPGYASIMRTDGLRRVSVTAEVSFPANTAEITADLETGFFQKLENDHPGVRVSIQGEKEKMRESFDPLMVGYPMAMLGIYIIIATIFRSYLQPLIILVTVPFGFIGAIYGHLLLGYELSMMSFFGMVALSGVVVNDSIVLIECINSFIAKGQPFYESVVRGGARRFRAIFLTTLSTCGGLTPLILEKDMQAKFLIPMAIALAGGVAFATLLTLVLIPCLMCVLNDLRRLARFTRSGVWPTAEDVEPGVDRITEEDEADLQRPPMTEPQTLMN